MKTAVLTAIYPEMKRFLPDFVHSLESQTCQSYDLLIVNDGMPEEEMAPFSLLTNRINTVRSERTSGGNRMAGLRECQKYSYDVIICADSDEKMSHERVEKVITQFKERPGMLFFYNNSVASSGAETFELYYKDKIALEDNIDFNVLGYGALNLSSKIIPYVLSHENTKVAVFDWWLASMLLTGFGAALCRRDIVNYYRAHANNDAGPVFGVVKERLKRGIEIKESFYSEMLAFSSDTLTKSEEIMFREKLKEVKEIQSYIAKTSFDSYFDLVKTYFEFKPLRFWWQDVVSLKQLREENSEINSNC